MYMSYSKEIVFILHRLILIIDVNENRQIFVK